MSAPSDSNPGQSSVGNANVGSSGGGAAGGGNYSTDNEGTLIWTEVKSINGEATVIGKSIDISTASAGIGGVNQGEDPFSYAGYLFHLPSNRIPGNNGLNAQTGNTCVFYSISAAVNYYKNNTSGDKVFYDYLTNSNNRNNLSLVYKIYNGGLGTTRRLEAYAQFLTGYLNSDIESSLLKGYPVLGAYQDGDMGHQVLITGFSYAADAGGFVYNFWNPQTGRYNYKAATSFFPNSFVVTGAK